MMIITSYYCPPDCEVIKQCCEELLCSSPEIGELEHIDYEDWIS